MYYIHRNSLAYWLLGLCNNYGYVVMLSAAHDILARDDVQPSGEGHSNFNPDRHCHELSTGVILLADVIPSLMVKFLAPFIPLLMNVRMFLVIVAAALGLLIVGLADSLTMAVIGVMCTSFSSGLGESTLLSFTVYFRNNKSVLSAWSSGTGGAGFFGSITYAALLAIGLPPRLTLFLLLIVPITMAVSFWIILQDPVNIPLDDVIVSAAETVPSSISKQTTYDTAITETVPNQISDLTLCAKFSKIPVALKFILPLGLVYYFEYLVNQGLYELTLFENTFLDMSTQYRWYQVFYQVGVFVSRSSISIIEIDKLSMLALLQGINLVYFTLEAIYKFTPTVIIVFGVILWEGILGGLTYVNAFHNIQKEIPPADREVVTGISTIADSVGITLAGFSAIPLHNKICGLPTYKI